MIDQHHCSNKKFINVIRNQLQENGKQGNFRRGFIVNHRREVEKKQNFKPVPENTVNKMQQLLPARLFGTI